jgi:hypothetical protein
MTLPMSRPQKHPDSGVYWLRKRVPEDLRALVGKREEKLSLGTRNPEEAKRRHAQALVEIEARWASLRGGGHVLTQKEIEQVAALLCSDYVARFGNKSAVNVQAAVDVASADRLWGEGNAPEVLRDIRAINWFALTADPDGSAKQSLDSLSAKLVDE